MRVLVTHATVFVVALAACTLGAPAAHAQCAFAHGQPTWANGWSRMVQAFVPCGGTDCDGFLGNAPNASTQAGIPACRPPMTYHQQAGSPGGGWRLDPATGSARIRLDAQMPTNVRIRLQLRDVRDANGPGYAPLNSSGRLAMLVRATFDDPVSGDMTQVDFPASFPITITNTTGDANLDTTFNVFLASIGLPPLPACTNFEVLEVVVLDPPDNKFLRPGHFRM